MKKLIPTTQYKKDLKRYKNNPRKLTALRTVLSYLQNEIELPKTYKPHMLKGNYNGFLECHIENDFLLIWLDKETDIIRLVRLGTHSELFNK